MCARAREGRWHLPRPCAERSGGFIHRFTEPCPVKISSTDMTHARTGPIGTRTRQTHEPHKPTSKPTPPTDTRARPHPNLGTHAPPHTRAVSSLQRLGLSLQPLHVAASQGVRSEVINRVHKHTPREQLKFSAERMGESRLRRRRRGVLRRDTPASLSPPNTGSKLRTFGVELSR